MSEKNLGGIVWTVDADTTGATTSVKQMGAQVDKTEAKLKELDTQTTKTAKGVKKGMAGMSRGAGQAGIQMQQFIGQVQGGQSVMLAFSQQAADVGIVLGAPMVGAILGISASLIGMMLPALMNSKTGMELLEKATENVKAAMTLGADGVVEYTAEMKKLKTVSETLLQLKIGLLIAEQEEALKGANKALKQSLSDAKGWATGYGAVYKIFKNETKAAFDSYKELKKVSSEFDSKKPVESMKALETAMKNAEAAGIKNTKVGRELLDQLIDMAAAYQTGEKFLKDLNEKKKDSSDLDGKQTKELEKHIDEVKSMVTALNAQAEAIGKTNREIALKTATEKGATEAQLKSINASFDLVEAEEKRILGLKALGEEQKELDRIMEQSFQNELKRANADKAEKKSATGFAEGVIRQGKSPVERLEEEQAQLLLLKERYVEQSALFDEALTANSKKQADLRSAYQIANANLIMSASSDLFGGLASLLKSSGNEQSNAYKAMFALSKGFAVAQAAMNLSLAISNASAISPWYASLPAVASVVSAGAGLASSIAGATYSGRENGGSVVSGQTYEVGEKNKPEMLMIPGNNGKVFSNAEMKNAMSGGGGGGAPIINNYAAGGGVSVSHRRDELTKRDVFDIMQNEMSDPNSRGRRGMQRNSNLTGVLNGGRRA